MNRMRPTAFSRMAGALHRGAADPHAYQQIGGQRGPSTSLRRIIFHPASQQEINHRNVIVDAIG